MKKLLAFMSLAVLAVVLPASSLPAAAAAETQTYLINFEGEGLPSDARQTVERAGGTVLKEDPGLSYIKASSSDSDFLSEIRKDADVASAGVEQRIVQETAIERQPLESTGDHPLYEPYQWDIQQVTQNGESWNLPAGKGSRDVVVAVIDTGVDLEHPDLRDSIVDVKSFVPGESPQDVRGHGSHVAGSIAADGAVLGVGPQLGIAALKVFPKEGGAPTSWIVDAIRYAADRDYDVMNMSLGSYVFLQDPDGSPDQYMADINLFKKAIAYAHEKGVTVVGSAGNAAADISNPARLTHHFDDGGDDKGATHRNPASNLLIRVSAGNKDKELTFYSNYGVGKIDLMAPGGDLGPDYNPETGEGRDHTYLCLSTVPVVENGNVTGHGYAWYGGTSMAAPKTAGAAGVVIAKHGKNRLSPSEVKSILQQSAEDLYQKGYDAQSGFGLVNAVSALNRR
ncbi:subtilase family protein [Melghirimyces profundicolus]|uniref:Subtilase family protein n=1 Tax=Melghirimyces profundicolus TaxID=1242148 RepID=A0A2T6BUG9_9BACL|nr:S8 family serine peptidase [Melghirimyces profundicolus]PTX59617.1 subtilase family protein [Melghirimyces profundicolus]